VRAVLAAARMMARLGLDFVLFYAALAAMPLLAVFAWWRFYFFHRNPPRAIAPGSDPVAPADGRIVYVEAIDLGAAAPGGYHRRVADSMDAAGHWNLIAIYLGILDVHVVRAPIAGTIRVRRIDPATRNVSMGVSFIYAALRRPLPIGHRGYLAKNECVVVEITGTIRLLVVLMADWWIDQVVMLAADGARVERGDVIGRIRMGSQVDVWGLAGDLVTRPAIGDRVRAGEMVIATIPAAALR
jgi:phosphatidylserine decarboxylase